MDCIIWRYTRNISVSVGVVIILSALFIYLNILNDPGVFTNKYEYRPPPIRNSVGEKDFIEIPRYLQIKSERLKHSIYYTYDTSDSNIGSMGLTSAVKSKVYSRTPNKTIHVGEFFSLFIDACDNNGRHRVKGGDFWMAELRSSTFNTAGKIIDYDNGTYEVIFFAAWKGVVVTDIVLIHPYEATYFLEKKLMPLQKRVVWIGYYTVGKKTESGKCMVQGLGSWTNKCEYPHPNALGGTLLLCDKPPTLPCKSMVKLKSSNQDIEAFFGAVDSNDKKLFSKDITYVKASYGSQTIVIRPSDKSWFKGDNATVMDYVHLPKCQGRLGNPLTDGYWNGSVWNSLACESKQWTKLEITNCVRGKHIILLGDSTTRQWGDGLLKILDLTIKHSIFQIFERSKTLNMTFQFHPYVISSRAEPIIETKFEVDIIDNLIGCDYHILISPWAHYTQWTMDTYMDRLRFIKLSLNRFKARCPNTAIVIKSPHTRSHKTMASLMFGSDFLLHKLRHVLRDFADDLNIYFLDAWDMNWSYPSTKNIHMPIQVIYQELYMFLSYVCQYR